MAWCETSYGPAKGGVPGGGGDDSEYDDWLGSSSSGQPSRPRTASTRSVSVGARHVRGSFSGLLPVPERSGQ